MPNQCPRSMSSSTMNSGVSTRFNQGLLADTLVCRVQRKNGLLHSVRFLPLLFGLFPATFQGRAHGQHEEVCGWTKGGTVFEVFFGWRQVHPQMDETAAVDFCPKTIKGVRGSLGLAGYYLQFMPGLAGLTNPWLISPERVQVKKAVCGEPLLYTPNFPLSFILQIDALNRGLGARLFQQVRGVDRPVVYISRKLLATQCVSCPLCPLCATKMKKIQN